MKYTAEIDWGAGGECRLSAVDLEEAWGLACQWARDGDWEDCSRVAETEDDRAHGVVILNDVWAHVSVSGEDDDEWREGEVLVWDTDEHDPPCPGGHEHEWESTVEVDGGCSQNPGWMSGSGRTWSASAHCAVCGMRRREYGDPDAAEQWRRTIVEYRVCMDNMQKRLEDHDLHGTGAVPCEVYPMPGDGWDAVTSVPCPVEGCGQTVVWWEAGYVPGYRVCMARIGDKDEYDIRSIRHRFVGAPGHPGRLIRDQEEEAE